MFSFEANYDVHMKKQGNCKDDYRNLLLGDASQSQSGVYPFAEVRLHVPITSSMCSSAIRRLRNTRRALRHLRCNHHQKELCREQLQVNGITYYSVSCYVLDDECTADLSELLQFFQLPLLRLTAFLS